jgi:hypothetical protein
MKIRPLGTELFHADGHDECNGRFSKFSERARKWFKYMPNEMKTPITKSRTGTGGDIYQKDVALLWEKIS